MPIADIALVFTIPKYHKLLIMFAFRFTKLTINSFGGLFECRAIAEMALFCSAATVGIRYRMADASRFASLVVAASELLVDKAVEAI